MVVHKTIRDGQAFVDFYFLDSSNMEHLCVDDEDIPDFFDKRAQDRSAVGMPVTKKYTMKMCIQSIFDARRSLEIL